MSNKLNLDIRQGEDFFRLLTFKDQNGELLDLTGFQFSGKIKETYASSKFLEFTFLVKDQTTNKGEVEMSLGNSASSRKSVSSKLNLLYDVEMNTGSEIKRILQGNINFDPEVTR